MAEKSSWCTKPDRSNHRIRSTKTPDDDTVDIAWDEGFLSTARPYRAEWWCQDQITVLTIFMPTAGIETFSKKQFEDLLESEKLVSFPNPERYLSAMPITDASGNDMWSINIVFGDEEQLHADSTIKMRKYDRSGESANTLDYDPGAVWERLVRSVLDRKRRLIAGRAVEHIKELSDDCCQSGEDSPLKTVWEEFKFQLAVEESLLWDVYEETVKQICESLVAELSNEDRQLLWLRSDGFWDCEPGEERKRLEEVGVPDDEVTKCVYECILEIAQLEGERDFDRGVF